MRHRRATRRNRIGDENSNAGTNSEISFATDEGRMDKDKADSRREVAASTKLINVTNASIGFHP
jgi:hypothetical protein